MESKRKSDFKYYILPLMIISCFLSYTFYFVCDDAFISFRYSRNLVNGLGLIYNENMAPIEGYSNFLWVIIGAVFYYFHLPLEIFLPFLSSLLAVCVIFLMQKILFKVFNFSFFEIFVSLVSLIFFPTFIIWSTSGLATMPYSFLMILLFYFLVLKDIKNKKIIFIVGILLSLIRFEGIFFMLFIYAISFLRREKRKEKIYLCVVTLAVYLIYFSIRAFYYQDLFPNTVYMKVGTSIDVIKRGIDYNIMYLLIEPISVIAFLGFGIMFFKKVKYRYEIFILYLALFFYPILVGGDFMPFFRFLLPASILQIIPLSFIINCISKRKALLIIFFCFLTISFLSLFNVSLIPRAFLSKFHFRLNSPNLISDREAYDFMKNNNYKRTLIYETLLPIVDKKSSIVMGGIGLVGFYTDFTMLDCYGLVNNELRNIPVKRLHSPGHDKRVSRRYFLKDNPDVTEIFLVDNNLRGDLRLKWYKETILADSKYNKNYQILDVPTKDNNYRLLAMIHKKYNIKNITN